MDKPVVALLTGRGNNTLKDKNIIPVKGKPLLSYPCEKAIKSNYITHYFCSSDDEKILSISSKLGFQSIQRPEYLARPDSKHVDTLIHALQEIKENHNLNPHILVVLLANSATVKTSWLDRSINIINNDSKISAVVPVVKDNDHHPLRSKKLNDKGFLIPYDEDNFSAISSNRQDLNPCYFLCHNFWTLRIDKCFDENQGYPPWNFMGKNVSPLKIDFSIDVHSLYDIHLTEMWLEYNKK